MQQHSPLAVYAKLLFIFFFLVNPLLATYVIISGEASLAEAQKSSSIFHLFLKGEPPRSFYEPASFSLVDECQRICPTLKLRWMPQTLWQLGVLHAFFQNEEVRQGILFYLENKAAPSYEEVVRKSLSKASCLDDLVKEFDCRTAKIPHFKELFFQIQKALADLLKRAEYDEEKLLHLILSELPPLEKWPEKSFPFWSSPQAYDLDSIKSFYSALKDACFISKLIEIERQAHKRGKWVVYRGYRGCGYPITLEKKDLHPRHRCLAVLPKISFEKEPPSSHALSFGTTVLGGAFFSLDATALTYAKNQSFERQTFFALLVTPKELKEFFRVGPLHPLVQMIAKGEMFHANTKIAARAPKEYENKQLQGYFMKQNSCYFDQIGYILALGKTAERFERRFSRLCKRSGRLFCKQKKL